MVGDDNDTDPENLLHSKDILPHPKTVNFGFQCIVPWCQIGNLPLGKANLKKVYKIRFQNMSRFNLFCQLYFKKYIKDAVNPDTNKHINPSLVLGEYFRMIGCFLIMTCYVGHSVRDLFLKDPIKTQKGAYIRLNHIISGRHLEKITHNISCTNRPILENYNPFLQQR